MSIRLLFVDNAISDFRLLDKIWARSEAPFGFD
jgi:hypothetical protein